MLEAARPLDCCFTALGAATVPLHAQLIFSLPGDRQIRKLIFYSSSHNIQCSARSSHSPILTVLTARALKFVSSKVPSIANLTHYFSTANADFTLFFKWFLDSGLVAQSSRPGVSAASRRSKPFGARRPALRVGCETG